MALKVSNTTRIPPFLAMQMMNETRKLEETGASLVHLEIGQPSTSPPPAVLRALTNALSSTQTHGYSIAFGELALRRRIAAHYQDWYQTRPSTDNIAVTLGSSLGFALAFLGAFDHGDSIAIANPGYPAYRNLMLALGLKPMLLPARAAEGWIPRLEALGEQGALPDGLLLASPANPTGVVMPDEDVAAVCKWCDANGVRLIMDEIYHGLTFDGRPTTALLHSDSAIVINSFSKYFCMTGWRLGWAILPGDLLEITERLAQNLYIGPARPMQEGAMAAFDDYDALDENVMRYRENRDLLLRELPENFLGEMAPAEGAFYIYADISNLSSKPLNSVDFAAAMLRDAHVAATAGLDFDQEQGQAHLRLSYAGSTSDMREASRRINSWLPKYLKTL
jgi:aspartate/methionine/tyrosine aminotransferase